MPFATLDADAGLFAIDGPGPIIPLRATLLRLADGSLLVYSPVGRLPEPDHLELSRTAGWPTVLLAPNHFHWLGVKEYLGRYPDAVPHASEVASKRLATRLEVRWQPTAELEARLPAHITLLEPPGTRTGEVWLRVEGASGVTWVVGDAFFNVEKTPPGMNGLACRLTGTTPGLRIGRTFTTLALSDRRAYREWLVAQLETDAPTRLVPCHGEVLEGSEVTEHLEALSRRRL